MTAPKHARVSDPARVRALAHPVRLELMDHLRRVEEATATECAQEVGESVASCSFHLRQLAKYGFVEPAERRGREKPWRLAGTELDVAPGETPGSLSAVTEYAGLQALHEVERFRAFLGQAATESAEWIEASTLLRAELWATAEELVGLREAIRALLEPFREREADPRERPAGARRSHLFATINPAPGAAGEPGDRS